MHGKDFFDAGDATAEGTTLPPRIPSPLDSAEDLERIAQDIKERYRGYREAQLSMNDQVFQVAVTVR